MTGKVILCGSFNPIHQGHIELLNAASLKAPDFEPMFELSLHNADKGLITFESVI